MAKKAPSLNALKWSTGFAKAFLYVSSAGQQKLWNKKLCSGIFNFGLEKKLCLKTRQYVNFGKSLVHKGEKIMNKKKDIKIANAIMEKRLLRGILPNFKTKT